MKRFIGIATIATLVGLAVKLIPSAAVASIAGLPAHPLVVHVAVVLLPLGAIALAVLAWLPRGGRAAIWASLAGIWIGAIASVLAESTGKALALRVGMPAEHAEWGERLANASLIAVVVSAAAVATLWWSGHSRWRQLARLATGVVAVVVLALTVLAGHSGATAVWGSVPVEDPSTPVSNSATPEASAASNSAQRYSLSEVASHDSAASCWTAIDGSVYDLTSFVSEHPGGPDRILSLCGTDGSAAFAAQHGGQSDPNRELAALKIGELTN